MNWWEAEKVQMREFYIHPFASFLSSFNLLFNLGQKSKDGKRSPIIEKTPNNAVKSPSLKLEKERPSPPPPRTWPSCIVYSMLSRDTEKFLRKPKKCSNGPVQRLKPHSVMGHCLSKNSFKGRDTSKFKFLVKK